MIKKLERRVEIFENYDILQLSKAESHNKTKNKKGDWENGKLQCECWERV